MVGTRGADVESFPEMISLSSTSRFVAVAIFAMSAAVGADQPKADQAKDSKTAAAETKAKATADSEKLTEKVKAQRENMLKEYGALQAQLKDATDEKRKEILQKLEEKQKAFAEANAALAKQIQEDIRRRRQGPKH